MQYLKLLFKIIFAFYSRYIKYKVLNESINTLYKVDCAFKT